MQTASSKGVKTAITTPKKTKDSGTIKAKQRFFFPGEGKYLPVSIEAATNKEALAQWEKTRVSVN